ncbi:MAG TPA: efflux RND transporter periplasmic adaptor subunit [Bacillota bacterium]|nr:efflux RND transporter periplasmic adaptor subunit [Bacillota bacterium]
MEMGTATQKPKADRKKIARILIGAVIAAIVVIVGYYAYEDYYYVTTDDATITGDIYKIAAKIPGKIVKVNVKEGDEVKKGQVLFELEQENVTNVDNAIIHSPIDGVVIQKTALPESVIGAGTTLAMVVSKKDLYVQANIEETNIAGIKVGQAVDMTVDMYGGTVFHGKVKEIGQATQSVFSLLPPMNTGGNFTKITQRVPVKISFDKPYDLKPGLNTMVKVHVK